MSSRAADWARAAAAWIVASAVALVAFAIIEGVLAGVAAAVAAFGVGLLLAACFAPIVGAVGVVVRRLPLLSRGRGRVVVGAVAFAGGVGADLSVPGTLYPGLHDLTFVLAASGALLAASVVPRRWIVAPIVVVVAVACVWLVGDDWRARAVYQGRYAARLVRWAQALADFDRDGYSGVAWGGDCDDLDEDVHPLARDAPGGGDANCNGVDPPSATTDAQLGLAPAEGDPRASVDVVVLVTIDALRADVPLASLGPPTFARMYAAGTRTRTALPLATRGVAPALRAAGVHTTFVSGFRDPTLDLHEGFDRVILPEKEQMSADDVTAAAVAELARNGGRRFLWVHYFDPHEPYDGWDGYKADVARVDAALPRLLAAIPPGAFVIVTSDHGEAFGEDGVHYHGVSAHDVIIRVPAWTRPPLPGDPLASHHDLPPTILGAFGLAPGERFGRSWLRLRAAPTSPLHDFVVVRSARYSSGDEDQTPMMAIVTRDGKLAVTFADDTREATGNVRGLYEKLALYRDIVGWP